MFGTIRFPFANQLAENKGHWGRNDVSCSGICGKIKYSELCGCDESCLFLGDCCYDFFYLCMRGSNLDISLARQEQIMNDFAKRRECFTQYIQYVEGTNSIWYTTVLIPMIAKCPPNATESLLNLCEDYGQHTFSPLPQIPVIHRGVIYRNIYCSLCNGACPEQVSLLAHTLINATEVDKPEVNTNQVYNAILITSENFYQRRFVFSCDPFYQTHDKQCLVEEAARECSAYQLRVCTWSSNDGQKMFKNLACAKCDNASLITEPCIYPYTDKTASIVTKWISLLDFVGNKQQDPSHMWTPNCASILCQNGYILKQTGCTYCTKKNVSSQWISVRLFHPTILLIFQSRDAADTARQMYARKFTNTDQYCDNTVNWLQDIGLFQMNAQSVDHRIACILLHISHLEVQFYINILQSDTYMEHVMPGLRNMLQAAMIFNFDVKYKAYCKQGIVATMLSDATTHEDGDEPVYEQINGVCHRKAPWAFVRSFGISKDHGRVWKLFCVDDDEDNFNCSHVNMNDFNACPKAEIHFISMSHNAFMTKSGHFINHHSEYIHTSNQTALICANQCKLVSISNKSTLEISVNTRGVLITCLIITFIIFF